MMEEQGVTFSPYLNNNIRYLPKSNLIERSNDFIENKKRLEEFNSLLLNEHFYPKKLYSTKEIDEIRKNVVDRLYYAELEKQKEKENQNPTNQNNNMVTSPKRIGNYTFGKGGNSAISKPSSIQEIDFDMEEGTERRINEAEDNEEDEV